MSKYASVSYDVSKPWVKVQRVLNRPVVIPPTPPPPPPVTWLISGVTAENGTGFSAPLEVTGLGTITSAASGSYGFLVVNGYSGVVIPHYANGTFDPESRTYTSVGSNYPGQDYAFYPYPPVAIQGIVYVDSVFAPLGTPVEFSGVGTYTQDLVNLQIRYRGTVPYGWTGTTSLPTYQSPEYTVTPGSYSYVNQTTDIDFQDFNATTNYFLISGTITNNGTGFSSALVTNFGTVTSAASGSYGYLVRGNYSGTTQPAYITTPGSYSYTNVASDQPDQNFDAPSPLLYFSSLDWIWTLPDPAQWNIQYFDTFGSFWDSWDMVPGTARTYNGWDYDFSFRVIGYSGADYNTGASNSVYIPFPIEISGTVTPGNTVYVTNGTATWLADFATGSYGYTVPSGWSGTTSTIDWITDPANRVYTNLTTSQPDQYLELTMPFLMVAANYFNWNTWSFEVPDRWFIYARNPVDLTYSVYATNSGTDYDILISGTGSYYHVTGVTAASNQATLATADTYAAPPLPPVVLLEGSVYSGTDGSGILSNLYVDGFGTISTDSFGYWSHAVVPPYTGYVAVSDPGFDGTFDPAYRSYVAEMAPQSNQDFVFWPTPPAPTDCQIPTALQTITDLPTPNNVSRSVNDPVNNLIWYIDDSYDYVYYVDVIGGTFAGSINLPSSFGQSAIAYDAVNSKVVVMDWSGSIHYIDPVAKTSNRVPGISMVDPGFHMLTVNQYGTAYATDNRNGVFGSVWAIDGSTETLIRSTKLNVYTDSICWASNINKLVINSGGAGQPAFYLFDPVTDTFAASTLLNPAVSFRYENYYIEATGHMLESYSGGSPSAVIDIANGTNATVIATVEPTRISNADVDTCTNHLFITNGNYAMWEYTLDGSYTLINLFDNGGLGISPNSCSHNRQSNLIYVANYSDGTIYTFMATQQSGTVGGLVWTIDQGVNPNTTGGYAAMAGGDGWYSGSAVGEDTTPFQTYNPNFTAALSNLGAPYAATLEVVYSGSLNESGNIDFPGQFQLYANLNGASNSVSFGGTTAGTNVSYTGTLTVNGTVAAGYNSFQVDVTSYVGGNFSSLPYNGYIASTGSISLTPLTPP